MGCEMKKYVFLFLVCCPLVAFGAPSVRALGSNAVSGTAGATAANKVTPVKASVVSSDRGSSVARVGSLRAKATTATTPSANSASTSRFPVILPTKVYNTANAPRPTGASSSTIINTDVDLTEIENRIEGIENLTSNTNVVNTVNDISNLEGDTDIVNRIEDISNLTNNAGDTTIVTTVNKLDGRSDSIRVAGSASPFTGTPGTASEPRAWIWVEQ